MKRYYFTITYLPKNCDVSLLAGRCIGILHGFMSSRGISNIGVCFPKWNEQTIGNQIAFVSIDKKQLIHLSQQSYFEMMAYDKLFGLSKILEVPANQSEVMFVRNQSVAKAFVGEKQRRLKRAKKRAEARGEVYYPEYQFEEKVIGHFHSIPVSSKGNGENFILHIQKIENTNAIENQFNNYGFATNQTFQGTVPSLNTLF
ncbi:MULTISPECIES: type I-F CRISPR-associated endoribonuclease Cas6/Csy4 [unclassified Pseudoalteromonas]|uniref:type I-F CRISPR-associated endoribonuclease Cas6/Csy4 n=1 Tax=unclassified Pseudoalteromonas TaxID=194690 RepID=UPI0025B5EF00|nr:MULTISPECIES: type I-F CRISPR-associated endoribonuclease Cas6/Csy4 [unclassified Pseudoalteromonas]MDN3380733.1 type I-F CRISPR-associated endoribonuclease Cas6/Csy4 [Pseudoalteromonas sp. APC 3893]MDN3389119.1 type I-F CRISPR-associated endoribonuclease Cas6/Csy4 [Pseudoalteromonas sp. APC 4017]